MEAAAHRPRGGIPAVFWPRTLLREDHAVQSANGRADAKRTSRAVLRQDCRLMSSGHDFGRTAGSRQAVMAVPCPVEETATASWRAAAKRTSGTGFKRDISRVIQARSRRWLWWRRPASESDKRDIMPVPLRRRPRCSAAVDVISKIVDRCTRYSVVNDPLSRSHGVRRGDMPELSGSCGRPVGFCRARPSDAVSNPPASRV
jgi:hypothetical protein